MNFTKLYNQSADFLLAAAKIQPIYTPNTNYFVSFSCFLLWQFKTLEIRGLEINFERLNN